MSMPRAAKARLATIPGVLGKYPARTTIGKPAANVQNKATSRHGGSYRKRAGSVHHGPPAERARTRVAGASARRGNRSGLRWAAVASRSGSGPRSGVATPNQNTAGDFRPDGLSQAVEPPLAEQLSVHENAISMYWSGFAASAPAAGPSRSRTSGLRCSRFVNLRRHPARRAMKYGPQKLLSRRSNVHASAEREPFGYSVEVSPGRRGPVSACSLPALTAAATRPARRSKACMHEPCRSGACGAMQLEVRASGIDSSG